MMSVEILGDCLMNAFETVNGFEAVVAADVLPPLLPLLIPATSNHQFL